MKKIKDIMLKILLCNRESVKSINPIKSVIQTIYDIVKANDKVPIAIGTYQDKVGTKEGRICPPGGQYPCLSF